MRVKSVFSMMFVLLFIMVGFAFACEGPNCLNSASMNVTGNYFGWAPSSDWDSSANWSNDTASAFAGGGVGGQVITQASAAPTLERVLVGYEVGYYGSDCHKGKCEGYWEQHITGRIDWREMPYQQNGWDYLGIHKRYEAIYRTQLVNHTASQNGGIFAHSDSFADSFVFDFGLTSIAGGFAMFDGITFGYGTADGICGNNESVEGNLSLNGYVGQQNMAKEVGYRDGQFVTAGNFSEATFSATKSFSDEGQGHAAAGDTLVGGAVTSGFSTATINPGRSLEATTVTNTSFYTNGVGTAMLNGAGGVNGVVATQGAYAGGTSTFGYNGTGTQASGNASMNANVHSTGNSSTVMVTGHSSSSVMANGQQPR